MQNQIAERRGHGEDVVFEDVVVQVIRDFTGRSEGSVGQRLLLPDALDRDPPISRPGAPVRLYWRIRRAPSDDVAATVDRRIDRNRWAGEDFTGSRELGEWQSQGAGDRGVVDRIGESAVGRIGDIALYGAGLPFTTTLTSALAGLPDPATARRLVELHLVHGRSLPEAAESLGTTPASAAQLLTEAVTRLCSAFSPDAESAAAPSMAEYPDESDWDATDSVVAPPTPDGAEPGFGRSGPPGTADGSHPRDRD